MGAGARMRMGKSRNNIKRVANRMKTKDMNKCEDDLGINTPALAACHERWRVKSMTIRLRS